MHVGVGLFLQVCREVMRGFQQVFKGIVLLSW